VSSPSSSARQEGCPCCHICSTTRYSRISPRSRNTSYPTRTRSSRHCPSNCSRAKEVPHTSALSPGQEPIPATEVVPDMATEGTHTSALPLGQDTVLATEARPTETSAISPLVTLM
jgi:hypothetical protein